MLTGDKLETAENIGYSCRLFNSKTVLFRLAIPTKETVHAQMENIIRYIKNETDQLSNEYPDWFHLPYGNVRETYSHNEVRELEQSLDGF